MRESHRILRLAKTETSSGVHALNAASWCAGLAAAGIKPNASVGNWYASNAEANGTQGSVSTKAVWHLRPGRQSIQR
jgi:hypothetical protein